MSPYFTPNLWPYMTYLSKYAFSFHLAALFPSHSIARTQLLIVYIRLATAAEDVWSLQRQHTKLIIPIYLCNKTIYDIIDNGLVYVTALEANVEGGIWFSMAYRPKV